MAQGRAAVITGLGVVSPIGVGRQAFWQGLEAGRSGIDALEMYRGTMDPPPIGGAVRDFDAKQFVTPRKSLKVMSREIELGFSAARLALEDAGLSTGAGNPERFGVVFGAEMIYADPAELEAAFRSAAPAGKFDFSLWASRAMGEMFPLWMLKYLPNMPACHIAIANDARGPNNSILVGEASSLLALAEAVRLVERGSADVVLAGGTAGRLHPMAWCFRKPGVLSARRDDPTRAMRPFDADRDGMVFGEGAAVMVIESREHARARGATVLGSVAGYGSAFEPNAQHRDWTGTAIEATIAQALRSAQLSASDIDHVNANGLSSRQADRAEAQAIFRQLGDVPVTAPKSFFGNLGAATGAVEMAASVLALIEGRVPITLNYDTPDPQCPVNVVSGTPRPTERPFALLLNQATTGQAAAVVLAHADA